MFWVIRNESFVEYIGINHEKALVTTLQLLGFVRGVNF